MRIILISFILLTMAQLAQAAGSNGEHPAIVARRVIAAQGYDYTSVYYPHPAGLRFTSPAPQSVATAPKERASR